MNKSSHRIKFTEVDDERVVASCFVDYLTPVIATIMVRGGLANGPVWTFPVKTELATQLAKLLPVEDGPSLRTLHMHIAGEDLELFAAKLREKKVAHKVTSITFSVVHVSLCISLLAQDPHYPELGTTCVGTLVISQAQN